MFVAPIASMSRRSKPSATPAQSGSPASSAASRFASSVTVGRPRAARRLLVGVEAHALLGAARELVIAVGELDATVIELETQRHARIVGVEARECGLRRRVAMQKSQRRRAESRPDPRADDEIEQLIAPGGSRVIGLQAQLLRGVPQDAQVGIQRIESCVALHGLAVTHELHRQAGARLTTRVPDPRLRASGPRARSPGGTTRAW